jgi:hypothetical protein
VPGKASRGARRTAARATEPAGGLRWSRGATAGCAIRPRSARFGKSSDEIADALVEGAARAAAAAGGATGMASALPVLPAFPAEIVAETLVWSGSSSLVAELHEA